MNDFYARAVFGSFLFFSLFLPVWFDTSSDWGKKMKRLHSWTAAHYRFFVSCGRRRRLGTGALFYLRSVTGLRRSNRQPRQKRVVFVLSVSPFPFASSSSLLYLPLCEDK